MPTASPTSLPTTCVGPEGQDLGNRYIVGACDTLIQISRLTGVSLQALIAANPDIQDPDLIFPGQVVVVPRP
jgi:nucleoid-associated protein YgaU